MSISRAAISPPTDHRHATLLVSLGLADSGQDVPPTWLISAMRSISLLWPLVILFKLFCTAAIILVEGLSWQADWTLAAVAMAVTVAIDLVIATFPRTAMFAVLPPHIRMWVLLPLAFLSGLGFSYALQLFSEVASRGVAPWMAFAAIAALLSVSIFGSRRILGLAYCVGASVPLMLISPDLARFAVLGSALGAIGFAAVRQAKSDQMRLLAAQAADLRGRRAERLLNEHERSGRGWFWETDRQGCLTYISETLAGSLAVKARDLVGRPITDLIAQGERQRGDGERTLGFHLSARSSFSDIAVRASMSEKERWWAISGQPIVNDFGQFHGFRGSGTDLTEMRRAEAEVNRLAQYDSLTGLANRVQMMRTLENAVLGANGQPGDCALLLLDLDRFKSVNDTLGHPAGDQLLRLVSQRLQRVIDDRGRVGRLGGDEFKVVMPGRFDRQTLGALSENIIASLSQPYQIDGNQVVIGASIGIAICPDHGVTADAMIRNSDLALYAAKGDGRGTYKFYSSEMHADAEDRRKLEEDLRGALSSDGLHLVYQPVVSSATEQVTGYEALLRWMHPSRGLISPTLFIPIAEDTGLITQIGEWVLRTACRDAAKWPDNIRVAVNVSPIQFANPALPATVMSALAGAGLSSGRLELEITESVFLNDGDGTDAMFARLKAIGVRLALDDFGTGYSSLGYLRKAPFDKIKIDQSFVRGAANPGNRNSAIIKSIVSLAEALSMDTTAEGAETHDELDLIRQLGCSHVQGYIYGKPMPVAEIMAQLATNGTHIEPDGYRSSRPVRRTMLRSIAVLHDSHRYTCRVRNVSSTGALIEGMWNVPDGTRFFVELAEGYVIEATARWSIDDRMGVEFLAQVDLNRLKVSVARALAS
ncbi:EAL domain-containing protein [soil metagenome]